MMQKRLFSLLLLGNVLSSSFPVSAENIETIKWDNINTKEQQVLKLPQKTQKYSWIDNKWVLTEDCNTIWNDFSKISEETVSSYEDGLFSIGRHYIYEYNAEGNLIKLTVQYHYSENDPWTNESMSVYEYDGYDSSFPYLEECYNWNWMFEDWEVNYSAGHYYDILRDDNNRVLYNERYKTQNSTIVEESCEFGYKDNNGPASNITVSLPNDYYETEPALYYDNIVWEKSDCNYLRNKDSRYFKWTGDKENLMRSATLYTFNDYGDLEFNSQLDFKYTEDGRTLKAGIYSHDGVHIMNGYEYDITPNGGYSYYYFNWNDLNDNKVFDKGEELLNHKSERVTRDYDENGNLTIVESKLFDENDSDFSILKYRQTYDIVYLEGSTVKERTFTLYNKREEIQKREKEVFDDFVETIPLSVSNTCTDNNIEIRNGYVIVPTGSRYIISDIQGRIVKSGISSSKITYDDLPSGLYIISVNDNKIKVLR